MIRIVITELFFLLAATASAQPHLQRRRPSLPPSATTIADYVVINLFRTGRIGTADYREPGEIPSGVQGRRNYLDARRITATWATPASDSQSTTITLAAVDLACEDTRPPLPVRFELNYPRRNGNASGPFQTVGGTPQTVTFVVTNPSGAVVNSWQYEVLAPTKDDVLTMMRDAEPSPRRRVSK